MKRLHVFINNSDNKSGQLVDSDSLPLLILYMPVAQSIFHDSTQIVKSPLILQPETNVILTQFQSYEVMIITMSATDFLSKSRGIKNLLLRIISVLSRFGVTSGKFARMLRRYSTVMSDLSCVPTFAITAVVLKRHPELVRELSRQGVEFAIHGYIHTDYGVLPQEEQAKHFSLAIDVFRGCRVLFTGFRAPFLRITGQTLQVLGNLGLPYDSSWSVSWDTLDNTKYSAGSWSEYERLLDFYKSKESRDCTVLPRFHDGIIEIPVSIPDDEALIERLGVTEGVQISAIWKAILQSTYDRGELFTLQLHPERIFLCETALSGVVRQARLFNPPVWVATLREIAAWWQERNRFGLEIETEGKGRYRVKVVCSDRATLLLRNCQVDVPMNRWFDGYQSVTARDFVLESPGRPVIGTGQDVSPAAVSFLRNEGFIVERGERADNYGIYLSHLERFSEADEKPLIAKLEQSGVPLLRYWRWPDQARSALSVTGDIDSITLVDFALRIMENWRQNRRSQMAKLPQVV